MPSHLGGGLSDKWKSHSLEDPPQGHSRYSGNKHRVYSVKSWLCSVFQIRRKTASKPDPRRSLQRCARKRNQLWYPAPRLQMSPDGLGAQRVRGRQLGEPSAGVQEGTLPTLGLGATVREAQPQTGPGACGSPWHPVCYRQASLLWVIFVSGLGLFFPVPLLGS